MHAKAEVAGPLRFSNHFFRSRSKAPDYLSAHCAVQSAASLARSNHRNSLLWCVSTNQDDHALRFCIQNREFLFSGLFNNFFLSYFCQHSLKGFLGRQSERKFQQPTFQEKLGITFKCKTATASVLNSTWPVYLFCVVQP